MSKMIRGAVIGYGGKFNMGKLHADLMNAAGMQFVAACDIAEDRMQQAAADFPGIRTFTKVEELLAQPDIDLVTVITPHNTHAAIGMQVLESGKHCIIEKPICIHADDVTALIDKAREKGTMITAFHNRRWDTWYTKLKEVVGAGHLGDIFHVEMAQINFGKPGPTWRSDKELSGGVFYDWGVHFVDYLLGVMPGKITGVRGITQNRLWHDISNEDQMDCTILFEGGATARIMISNIAMMKKPRCFMLGTKGALIDTSDGALTLVTRENGQETETKFPYDTGNHRGPWVAFYHQVFDHLVNGAPLVVTPEQARRNIAVIETAGRSAECGSELPLPYED